MNSAALIAIGSTSNATWGYAMSKSNRIAVSVVRELERAARERDIRRVLAALTHAHRAVIGGEAVVFEEPTSIFWVDFKRCRKSI